MNILYSSILEYQITVKILLMFLLRKLIDKVFEEVTVIFSEKNTVSQRLTALTFWNNHEN